MPWNQYVGAGNYFSTPDAYATEIKRKDATGGAFTDQAAADAFRQAHPNYFQPAKAPASGGGLYVSPDAQRHADIVSATDIAQRNMAGAPPAPVQNPMGQNVSGAAQNITSEFTPDVQSLLDQIRSYISTPAQTPDQMLQSDYGQQMMGSVDAMRDQQMRHARAQLAGAGGLYPDDTRAADRFAQVGSEAARMQAGEILPRLMQAAQSQRGMGLNELIQGLGAQSGQEVQALNRILQTFQTVAPYSMLTEAQRQDQPFRAAEITGEWPGGTVPGSTPGGETGFVPARQYVEQMGGKIDWRRAPDGGNIVTINGIDIDVEGVGGSNRDGRVFLPQYVIDQVMGVR